MDWYRKAQYPPEEEKELEEFYRTQEIGQPWRYEPQVTSLYSRTRKILATLGFLGTTVRDQDILSTVYDLFHPSGWHYLDKEGNSITILPEQDLEAFIKGLQPWTRSIEETIAIALVAAKFRYTSSKGGLHTDSNILSWLGERILSGQIHNKRDYDVAMDDLMEVTDYAEEASDIIMGTGGRE